MVFVAEGDMNEPALFRLGDFRLQKGMTLKDARIVYRTYGTLNAGRSNAILYPTSYAAHHTDIEWLIGAGRVLDPERWFRSEEHTSELQSLMRLSYAVFCLKKTQLPNTDQTRIKHDCTYSH